MSDRATAALSAFPAQRDKVSASSLSVAYPDSHPCSRLADMTLIKLQGPDGNIAPAVAIPPGRDRVSALSVALQNIAAMGATEMYAKIYENSSLTAQWAAHVPLNYVTTR